MCKAGVQVDFNWKKYLDLADELAANRTDEAKIRASISRAYYAAFCNARNYMIEKDLNKFPPEEKEHHKYLVKYFKGEADESKTDNLDGTRDRIGRDLNSMRHDRRKADYENYVCELERLNETASDVIKRSRRVISSIERGGF
ncbi:MAG: HEPN domain-containing protein [Methanothrix sp.]|nr:MAG: HEPN domain-containing protein [Methanothrix sp.]